MRTPYDIIIRPIISEQSMEDMDIKKYVFEVAKDADKIEIARAVEQIFGVRVIKVNTAIVGGKKKHVGSSRAGLTKTWKKAIVKLSEDSKTIEIFENMA